MPHMVTEQRGGIINPDLNQEASATLTGFGDFYVAPLGLTWSSRSLGSYLFITALLPQQDDMKQERR